jgi:hypothetical protein
MRYERKYRIEALSLAEVAQVVKGHPLSFRKQFPDRQVNSLYLDTADLSFLRENLSGVATRRKYRIRWYGSIIDHASKPVLEMKAKNAEIGHKLLYPLADFDLSEAAQIQAAVAAALAKSQTATHPDADARFAHPLVYDASIFHPPSTLETTLLVTYQRSYYASWDGKFRLTIDRDMRFLGFNARHQIQQQAEDRALVVEVKYDAELDQSYSLVGQRLPFRLTKNSKYVTGMLSLRNC